MTTPNAMPKKKVDPIHTELLVGLTAIKPESWDRKHIDPESPDPKKPNVIKTKVTSVVPRFPLARNVSDLNIERAAKRWIA
jgi:hypothetical protein